MGFTYICISDHWVHAAYRYLKKYVLLFIWNTRAHVLQNECPGVSVMLPGQGFSCRRQNGATHTIANFLFNFVWILHCKSGRMTEQMQGGFGPKASKSGGGAGADVWASVSGITHAGLRQHHMPCPCQRCMFAWMEAHASCGLKGLISFFCQRFSIFSL